MKASEIQHVFVGSPRAEFHTQLSGILKDYPFYELSLFSSIDQAIDFKDSHTDFNPAIAIIDGQDGTNLSSDWCQSVKMTFPDCPIIILYSSEVPLDFPIVHKNGASLILNLNYDSEFIGETMMSLAPIDLQNEKIQRIHLTPVDIRDLDSEMDLNFDVFVHLPQNKKSIRLRRQGDTLEQKQLDNFKTQKKPIYIKKTEINQFFEYTRTLQSLRNLEGQSSPTEKKYRSKEQLKNLNQRVLNSTPGDFTEGKQILESYYQIIEGFEFCKERTPQESIDEVLRLTGNHRSNYNDALCLAAYASHFSHLLGWNTEQRRSMALAGLLHNLGFALVPFPLLLKPKRDLNESEKDIYQGYPEKSVLLIKGKKLPLKPESSNAVLEHRELQNGKGFPHKLAKQSLSEAGKLLSICYIFMTLTSLSDEEVTMAPDRAMEFLKKEAIHGDGALDLILTTALTKKWFQFITS